jgi:hypothetical protein
MMIPVSKHWLVFAWNDDNTSRFSSIAFKLCRYGSCTLFDVIALAQRTCLNNKDQDNECCKMD